VGSAEVVAILLAALKDEDRFVRYAAARALGSAGAGSADVVAALLAALKDEDKDVRSATWDALWKVCMALDEPSH
jgi:HEAT repeat protein